MAQRWRDWLAQAKHDLEQAAASRNEGRHDWACFAAHQASEKAVKVAPRSYTERGRKGPRLSPASCRNSRRRRPSIWSKKGGCSTTITYQHVARICTLKERPSNTTVHCRANGDYVLPVTSSISSVKRWQAHTVAWYPSISDSTLALTIDKHCGSGAVPISALILFVKKRSWLVGHVERPDVAPVCTDPQQVV